MVVAVLIVLLAAAMPPQSERIVVDGVLDLIWSAAGARVSWRLSYDYEMEAYYLKIKLVRVGTDHEQP